MKHLQYNDINFSELLEDFHNPRSGAVVLFSGEVRDNNKGRKVTHMVYEAYEPMADKVIGKILKEAKIMFNLNHAVCIHRLGRVEISGCAVVVITGAGHRKESYDANRYIIDRVKKEVPIWKNEFFADGSSEWGQNSDSHSKTLESEHEDRHETAK